MQTDRTEGQVSAHTFVGFFVCGMMGRFHLKVTRIKLERKIVGIFGLLFFVIFSV
tara:strand:- start:2390 stop:2554 length:165 start_codon:yes stop_codon:yes gene_type:complete